MWLPSTVSPGVAQSRRSALMGTGAKLLTSPDRDAPRPPTNSRRDQRGCVARRGSAVRRARRNGGDGVGLLVNPLGESILGDDEPTSRRSGLGKLRRGCRRCFDQGVGARGQPRRARLRSQHRTNQRTVARDLSRRVDEGASRFRQSRHGGVPRSSADCRRVHQRARRAGVPSPRGGDRAAGVPARQPRRAGTPRTMGRTPPRQRGRRHQDPDRQRGEPGDGSGRGRTARLGGRAVPDEGRRRRQLQVDARIGCAAGVGRSDCVFGR